MERGPRSPSPRVERGLRASSRRGVRDALGFPRPDLRLSEIQRLTAHLAALSEERRPLRVGILRTYTTEMLAPYWAFESELAGIGLDLREAPLGSLLQEGLGGSMLRDHEPELTLLFLQWRDLDARLSDPAAGASEEVAAAAERRLSSLVGPLREALPGLLVVTLLPRFGESASGSPAFGERGETGARLEPVALKARLAEALRGAPGAHFLDLDAVLGGASPEEFFDPRLWRVAQFPFSVLGAQRVARRLLTFGWLLKFPPIKCIVVDADNTLWGGIVGEDGPAGIALGPEPPGSAYVALQERVLGLRGRGILLALCSRNDWSDVREVLAAHPHQRLREEHFAAIRVNWDPKPENIRSIASELRLGLDSLLFLDDSPQECGMAAAQMPELAVIRVPETPAEIPALLDGLPGLERLSLTPEDADRARYYADDHRRRRLEVQSATVDEYLAGLHMVMTIGLDDPSAAPRIAQLTQKTNQFNLTTRRYTEAEIARWIRDPDSLVAHFALEDVFGDNGVVGVAILRGVSGPEPEFDTFLQSCRVIGRSAESAFLDSILEWLRARGAARARGRFVASGKNALVRNFWREHGFRETENGEFVRDLAEETPGRSRGPISVIISERVPGPIARRERV